MDAGGKPGMQKGVRGSADFSARKRFSSKLFGNYEIKRRLGTKCSVDRRVVIFSVEKSRSKESTEKQRKKFDRGPVRARIREK